MSFTEIENEINSLLNKQSQHKQKINSLLDDRETISNKIIKEKVVLLLNKSKNRAYLQELENLRYEKDQSIQTLKDVFSINERALKRLQGK